MKNYKVSIFIIISFFVHASYNDDYFIEDRVNNCSKFKNELANISSQVTLCFLEFFQPLRICSKCLNEKQALISKFDALNSDKITYGDVNCKLILLQSDISTTIDRIYDVLNKEWSEVNCGHCYKKDSPEFTEEYLNFIQLAKSNMNCLQSFTNASLNFSNSAFETIWNGYAFDSAACTSCRRNYSAITSFYENMEKSFKGKERDKLWNGVCGDMGDIMNTTQYLWSKEFNCDNRQLELIYILPLFIVVVVNLLFYCLASTYFHDKMRVVFYKQRRLKHLSSDDSNSTILETIK